MGTTRNGIGRQQQRYFEGYGRGIAETFAHTIPHHPRKGSCIPLHLRGAQSQRPPRWHTSTRYRIGWPSTGRPGQRSSRSRTGFNKSSAQRTLRMIFRDGKVKLLSARKNL